MKKNLQDTLQEKNNNKLRSKIYKIIEEEARRFHIKKDYIWIKLFSSSDYTAIIKIVKDKMPIKEEKFLENISYRLYRELGIKKTDYDLKSNPGKYQKLHY